MAVPGFFIFVRAPRLSLGFKKHERRATPFGKIKARPDNRAGIPKGGHSMTNDNKSLARTTWNCKYHIKFAPKYRRKIFCGEHKAENGKILGELCSWKRIQIIEGEHSYAGRNPAERKCVGIHGFSQRKERHSHPRETRKFEIQIREPKFLVPVILHGYSWEEHKEDCGVPT